MQATSKTPKEIHEEWQSSGVFTAKNGESKPKYYCLDMFPYPSAQGLHVGHPEGYTATDILSRYKRMHGMNVLHPMGWDAFGLPAENYAIKTGVDPDTSTHANITNFRRQIQDLGFSYDWSREVDTSSPEYYRWTQWMFAQMYKNGLAYKKKARVNWCNTCQTVLANEQVIDGMCERSKDPVVQKDLEQWFFKVTAYAERLLTDLDTIDWPEPIKLMQRNWIGKSVGAEIDFPLQAHDAKVTVFTTRPDTLYGATYIVLAPENPLVEQITIAAQKEAVQKYQQDCRLKNDLDRTALNKEKTGVWTGAYAINPATQKPIPVWIADYVLNTYGTGAVMAVPAHDQRDWDFVMDVQFPKDYIRQVISAYPEGVDMEKSGAWTEEGELINSGPYNGMHSSEAKKAITESVGGRMKTTYRIRDWLISRQRYWGAPIPIVYDPEGNPHLVEDKHLPLKLPTDVDFRPKGISPLGSSASYAALAEELYGKGWHFEVDTMDTFVCSSWYYLRYCDPNNTKEFASQELLKAWLPVDMYVGGAEHAVLHLLYARFFHKALQDFGFIPQEVGPEPFKALRNQGMILGEDHQKMSKSRGNVINPDDIVGQYGADTLRMYEMFMGPFEEVKPWSTESIKGIKKFLERVRLMVTTAADGLAAGTLTDTPNMSRAIHKTVKKVTEDIEGFRFNTAISTMMIFCNEKDAVSKTAVDMTALKHFVLLLAPFAPFTCEEIWPLFTDSQPLATAQWPTYDASLVQDQTVTIAVQVNGKTRGTVTTSPTATQQDVLALAQADEKLSKHIADQTIAKVIYVPGRILNVIVKG